MKELMKISSSVASQQLAQRRGDYGFDAPYVPIIFLCIGLAVIVLGLLAFLLWQSPLWGIVCLLYGMYMLLSSASYIYTTRRGKFQVWAELLVGLNLRGDEQILDMGCGRGAVLLMAASFLNEGKATALPAPIALAATWDLAEAQQYGDLLGREAWATGHNVVLR